MMIYKPQVKTFFENLKKAYDIRLIYYPGSYTDDLLEIAFKRHEIVTTDKDLMALKTRSKVRVAADYNLAPFADKTFDAIFYQDNHAERGGVLEIYRTLKMNGILIYSKDHCGDDVGLRKLRRITLADTLDISGTPAPFTVLQKSMHLPNEDQTKRIENWKTNKHKG